MKLFGKDEIDVAGEMTAKIAEAKADNELISKLPCPSCSQSKLRAVIVERGKVGWETRFFCDACKTAGILNHTGFHVELSKGEKK